VVHTSLTNSSNTIHTADLPNGLYTYKLVNNNEVVQSGRLISQK
jgi:hypothetical protein